MPPPSDTSHPPSIHSAAATTVPVKSPDRVLAESEAQWLFTPEELANTPSIQDGMSPAEEKEMRAKGVNFIVQVGIMLKLPQLTLSTASVFFQRFLMRASLKKARDHMPKLHPYQIAATALFLATKVEESSRKLRDMILAFCRVAQKNANLVIDEQSKDWWKWRDCILYNEDVLLETLCFDLTVESPHRQLFEMLKYYGLAHNKRLRNAAWGFVTDSNNTPLCLLCSSRTIAVATLYAACKYCDVTLPDDAEGRPWWEKQHVKLKDIRRAVEYMQSNYDHTTNKVNGMAANGGSEGNGSIYAGLSTPGCDGPDSTRLRGSASPFPPPGSERRTSNSSSIGMKRDRDEAEPTADNRITANGTSQGDKRPRVESKADSQADSNGASIVASQPVPPAVDAIKDPKEREEALRVENGNKQSELDAKISDAPQKVADASKEVEEGQVSEEGEVEE